MPDNAAEYTGKAAAAKHRPAPSGHGRSPGKCVSCAAVRHPPLFRADKTGAQPPRTRSSAG